MKELKEKIINQTKEIFDPEIPINIYDLGFIRSIDIERSKVNITMTLTIPGCPIHMLLSKEIKERLLKIDGIDEVDVELSFDPRWTVADISEAGKMELRKMGYNV